MKGYLSKLVFAAEPCTVMKSTLREERNDAVSCQGSSTVIGKSNVRLLSLTAVFRPNDSLSKIEMTADGSVNTRGDTVTSVFVTVPTCQRCYNHLP